MPYLANRIEICVAETQKSGRGRFCRFWHSPFGQNIYLSLRYPFRKDVSKLEGLSLVCGLAVCRAVETTCRLPFPVFIKWPNDVMCKNKKLAGVLIEIHPSTSKFCSAIVGVGLNANMKNDLERIISQNWTSLVNLTEIYQDRNRLCSSLINNLVHYLEHFSRYGFSFFQSLWKKKDYLFNKPLCLIESSKNQFSGIGAGVNEKGNLILKLTDGLQKSFFSGETNLIK
ncbi:biotin--[acetyl-CoA-carboxylase] ligase [Coxiella endosymbiont of Amblyomma sculptum]|nr:biotin--[acetyl-CoA-carboxylase] ligase [Coxiella endosymbiont of Amblyomma sculptum]